MDLEREKNRIYVKDDNNKTIGEVTFYEIEKGKYNIDHTFVENSFRGQGIGSKLVEEAVNAITEKGAQIEATCPFAQKWLSEHK